MKWPFKLAVEGDTSPSLSLFLPLFLGGHGVRISPYPCLISGPQTENPVEHGLKTLK